MELFNLFTQYHEISFQEFKKDLINSIKIDILNIIDKKNINVCGHKRTQNRGYCKRICSGYACKYHLKYVDINNNFILKSDVSDTFEDVTIHKDICKNIINRDILSNIKIFDPPKSNIILRYDLNTDINNYIFNFKKKREKKREKKNERRKAKILQSHNSHISEPSDETIDIPNGVLLKENNIYYTINFYDQKVVADNIEGIKCYYCKSMRYTNSGPCLNPNCHNRSFDDTKFKKYFNINKKQSKSI